MKKKLLSLALACALVLALAVPAAAAGGVTPTGFTLFRLSSQPAGGYAPAPHSYLVVEDGTSLTCPAAEMQVTRCEIALRGEDVLSGLTNWLKGYYEETGDWTVTSQTVPAGQALTISGCAAYAVQASAGGVTEELWVINRSTMLADTLSQDSLPHFFYDHQTPAGTQTLAGCRQLRTTAQPQGYGVAKAAWSWAFTGDPRSGVTYSDVCRVLPQDAVLYAPAGYYFSYGYNDLVAFGDGGLTTDELRVTMNRERNLVYSAELLAYGCPEPVDSLSFVFSDYSGKSSLGDWSLLRLSEAELTGARQYASAWALAQVDRAIDAGLMTYPDCANLQGKATRSEFAALAVRLYEKASGKAAPLPASNPFEDTDDENDLKAYALGLIQGTGEARFSPIENLTREQAATILARLAAALGDPLPARAPDFADRGGISAWAADAVGSLSAAGIMSGVGSGRFDPQGVFSREQAVLTVLRMYEQLQ